MEELSSYMVNWWDWDAEYDKENVKEAERVLRKAQRTAEADQRLMDTRIAPLVKAVQEEEQHFLDLAHLATENAEAQKLSGDVIYLDTALQGHRPIADKVCLKCVSRACVPEPVTASVHGASLFVDTTHLPCVYSSAGSHQGELLL